MGIWTQEDVDKLKAAVLALAVGEAVMTVKYSGPPAREVTYKSADLADMKALLAEARSEVAADAGTRTTVRYARTKKGVYP